MQSMVVKISIFLIFCQSNIMADKKYIKQRIDIFANQPIDPNSDLQVKSALLGLNIKLPQKNNLTDSLNASNENHEFVKLIKQYRNMS